MLQQKPYKVILDDVLAPFELHLRCAFGTLNLDEIHAKKN